MRSGAGEEGDRPLPPKGLRDEPPPAGHGAAGGPFVSPRIASDGSGNVIVVWIHDNNRGLYPPEDPDPAPDVWYAYYDGSSEVWSDRPASQCAIPTSGSVAGRLTLPIVQGDRGGRL